MCMSEIEHAALDVPVPTFIRAARSLGLLPSVLLGRLQGGVHHRPDTRFESAG